MFRTPLLGKKRRVLRSSQPYSTSPREAPDLVVVLKQLNDDLDVVMVVLDGDDSKDVRGVFCVRVLAVFVRQNQTRVSLLDLCTSDQIYDIRTCDVFREYGGTVGRTTDRTCICDLRV